MVGVVGDRHRQGRAEADPVFRPLQTDAVPPPSVHRLLLCELRVYVPAETPKDKGERIVKTQGMTRGEVEAALARAGLDAKLNKELLAALGQLEEALAIQPARQSARVLQRFDQRLAEDLAETLHGLRDVATPAPVTVAMWPLIFGLFITTKFSVLNRFAAELFARS